MLITVAIGHLAPAVTGDSIGFFFSGRLAALVPPVVAFLAVTAVGLLATAPIWLIGGRRVGR